jgi:hypothetical protein
MLTRTDAGADSEAYLSDSHGRRVTPRIDTSVVSNPTERAPATQGPGRPRRNIEQELMTALEARTRRVRQIGPGVDRGGSKIVTEKRRGGFLDDEDFETIIEDENED